MDKHRRRGMLAPHRTVEHTFTLSLALVCLVLTATHCRADGKIPMGGGGSFWFQMPESALLQNGFGMEAIYGWGGSGFALTLSVGVVFQSADDAVIEDEVRSYLPSEPRVTRSLCVQFQAGPSLRYALPVSSSVRFGVELGVRGISESGPWVAWDEALPYVGQVEHEEQVEFDTGLVGRLAGQLEFGGAGAGVLFVGAGYDNDLGGSKATFKGEEIGRDVFDAFFVRLGAMTRF